MSDDDEATVVIVGPRKGGRPRVSEPRDVTLSLRCLPSEYDEVAKLALKHGTTVSKVARQLLRRALRG